jgi:hypothetical protein
MMRLARASAVRPSVLSHDLKLKRAGEHIEALKVEIDGWLGTDAYTIGSEIDPETGDTVRRAQVKRPPPPQLSLLIGDAVQNLRSALDHTVYFLAERNLGTLTPEIEGALMFPIVGCENSKGELADGSQIFAGAVRKGQLKGVPDPARTFIENEQPYHWGTEDGGYRYHWLWVLHNLNRIDKHRRLAVTTAWLDLPGVSHPTGVTPRITWTRAEGPVKDGDVLVTYSGADKGVNAHLTRAIAIDEGTAGENDILRCLTNVQDRVQWIVGWLAQYA